MDVTLLILAYTAGIFTFLSPCSFPMLPSYISYFMRREQAGAKVNLVLDGIKLGLITSLGFLFVLIVAGSLISLALVQVARLIPYFVILIGVCFAALGIIYLAGKGRSFETFLRASHLIHKRFGKEMGPFIYGIAYALAAMGCSLPIFLAIISGSSSLGLVFALISILLYFLGMMTLMIPVSILTSLSRELISTNLMSLMHYVERATGLIMLGTGLYLILFEYHILLA